MKRLTKKVSLRNTAEMYGWLGEDPKRIKEDWPGWEATGWAMGQVECQCFLCQYVSQWALSPCDLCPLYGKWDGYKQCSDDGSPWRMWEYSTGKKRQHAAQLISKLCHDELARLEAVGRKGAK